MKRIVPKEVHARTWSNLQVVAAGIGMYALLIYFGHILGFVQKISGILSPFMIGIALAFLLNAPLKQLDALFRRLLCKKKPHPRLCRGLAVLCCYILFLLAVTAFCSLLVPQLVQSIRSIIFFVRNFIVAHSGEIEELLLNFNFLSREGERLVVMWENVVNQAMDYTTFLLNNVVTIFGGISSIVYQLFIGLIASVYILLDKDKLSIQAKKICYALFSTRTCESLIGWTRRASSICSGFLVGKILDSGIMGVLCYIGMRLFRIEYPLLISVIIGVTNILPFFGPFIGAIPSILILLIINPFSALWFTIFILVLQQIDGNIIGPRILGDSVGISPLWIMFAIILGSGLFGFAGMLLSVPVFALIYAILRTLVDGRLQRQNLRRDDEAYAAAPEISPEDSELAGTLFEDEPVNSENEII